MGKPLFHGVIPPISTVFNEDYRLDQVGMGRLIDYLIENGVNGLFFLGTGGEFSQLLLQERKEIAEFAVEYVNHRVPVLIGTGSTSTHEAVELSQHSEKIGADGIVVINPYYMKLSEDNLYRHYQEVCDAVALPILLYNFPAFTGQDLTPDFVLRAVKEHPNIVGIKETVDSVGHIKEMILTVKEKFPDFLVFSGFDDHFLQNLSLGGDGAISSSVNFAPHLAVGLYDAFTGGDLTKAVHIHRQLAILSRLYQLDQPFTNVIKEATKLCGIGINTAVLPPGRPLEQQKKKELLRTLEKASLSLRT